MAKDKARLQANGNNDACDARPKGGPPPAARMTKYGRPLSFFILFLPFCALVARYSAISHYTLPTPLNELRDPATSLPQFSEGQALEYIKHYAQDIGYRIVGTPEMDETVAYTVSVLQDLRDQLTRLGLQDQVEIEIEVQTGDGSHLFEILNKRVWKKYYGIQNVIVRLSNGTDASKANAILANAHLDSTLPSPGAADDGAGVAVLLEVIRVLSQTPGTKLNNALVFLFNGAEETFQDASHLFITQHPWKETIRAVINLEACGVAGAEMLFQATSNEMIKAYAQAPRTMGTVIATEVFATGLIGSDTDFRQFVDYGNLTGLDIALVKDSYKYHTRLDAVEYIEPGAMQHFGDNVLAIMRYLADKPTPEELQNIVPSRNMLFFTAFAGKVFVLAKDTHVTLFYLAVFLATTAFVMARSRRDRLAGYFVCLLSIPASIVGGLVSANVAAFIMAHVLDKPMSYFKREWYCLALYAPPTLVGIASVQYTTAAFLESLGLFKVGEGILQHALLTATLVFSITVALVGHTLGVMSAYTYGIGAVSLLFTLFLNDFVLVRGSSASTKRGVSTLSYILGQVAPLLIGTEGLISFLDVIIPLTGRMGRDAPSDHITASLVALVGFLLIPTFPAMCHRWGRSFLLQLILLLVFITGLTMSIFAAPTWRGFDELHPKRILCLYMENTTSHTMSLHIAGVDGTATLLTDIVENTASQLALPAAPVKTNIDDDIPDWDVIYPVTQFLQSYRIPLAPLAEDYVSPFKDTFVLHIKESRLNAVTQTRTLTIEIKHPGIIWSVIAFDADVISWDLGEQPIRGSRRYHIKEASAYKLASWTVTMTIQLTPDQFEAAQRQSQRRKGQRPSDPAEEERDRQIGGLKIDYSGLDVKRMWHAQGSRDRVGMEFVERLDSVLPDWVDPMLLTAVAGVQYV